MAMIRKVLLVVLVALLVIRYIRKMLSKDQPVQPASTPKAENKVLYFTKPEVVAMLRMAYGTINLSETTGAERQKQEELVRVEMKHLGVAEGSSTGVRLLVEIQQTSVAAAKETLASLKRMSEDKRRYVLGFVAQLVLSDVKRTEREEEWMNYLCDEWQIYGATYGELIDFWKYSIAKII